MDITTVIVVITALYGVLFFFDAFFKSCAHYPYITFLNGTGFKIKPFQLTWNTTACNRIFLRWGNQRFLSAWFTCGMYITLALLPISLIFLIVAITQNVANTLKEHKTNVVLEPLIPGINLPGSEITYYSLSMIICSVIHELGHALASVKEDVHIINLGVNIIFVLPIAYVNLSAEQLNALNPWRFLKIMCAGVWHNLMLSLIACLLYTSLPFCYSSLFKINEGVYVNEVAPNSPLSGNKGLEKFDIITRINSCDTINEDALLDCLHKAYLTKLGYCVDTDIVHNLDESVPLRYTTNGLDCCDSFKTESICFEYIENNNGVLEIPPHACLPARIIIETSKFTCGTASNCPNKLHCIKPLLDNTTTLLKIVRHNRPDVIYIGHPGDIIQTVTTTSYIPKYQISPFFIPDNVMKFLEYIIVISTGLAIVNVIPCLFMDGQHITNATMQIVLKNNENKKAISVFICVLCTFLLVAHCIYTVLLKLTE